MSDGVWADVVGQQRAIDELRRAVAAAHGASAAGFDTPNQRTSEPTAAMTHGWLLTGPPGSGRSVAGRAFAAALECPDGGCGTCNTCRTALSGAHPDVTLCRTEQLSIGVEEVRELVRKSAMAPMSSPWQVLVIEDSDRLTDRAVNALLKSLEEPTPRTVWVLCAPNADDLPATIRSRAREVRLVTPPDEAVIEVLTRRDGVAPDVARVAARAAQGHIGKARALALDADAREARDRAVSLPGQWTSLGACLTSAAEVVARAQEVASAQTAELDAKEKAELDLALGFGTKGAKPRNVATAVNQLADEQKARAKRVQRDALDAVLTDLATWYRDVLTLQLGGDEAGLVNVNLTDRARSVAASGTPERTTANLDAILAVRRAIDGNVPPLLAIEALFIQLAGVAG